MEKLKKFAKGAKKRHSLGMNQAEIGMREDESKVKCVR